MPSSIDDGTVLLTGASSGIGREMARQLAPRARRLVLVARRRDRLEALAQELQKAHSGLEVLIRAVDLSDREAVRALCEEMVDFGVDVLINNAGFGDHSPLVRADARKLEDMVMVDVLAVVMLTRALVPGMVERGRGGVLNVSSAMGLVSLPHFATYTGCKHFVTAFTDALAGELAGTGVHVTQVCPGPVLTEFNEVANVAEALDAPGMFAWTPESCARDALRGLDRNQPIVVPGLSMRAALAVGQRIPRWVYRRVGARITRR